MHRGLHGFEECPLTSLISELMSRYPRRRRVFTLFDKVDGRVTDGMA